MVRVNVDGKAVISVGVDAAQVVIEDIDATDGLDCSSGKCASVKIEGRDFHVTLRRAHIAGKVMGVLTSIRGGTLVIEDSLIEEQGQGARDGGGTFPPARARRRTQTVD